MTKPNIFPRRARAAARVGMALGCLAAAGLLQGCGRRGPPEAPNAAVALPPPGVTDAPLTTPSGVAALDDASQPRRAAQQAAGGPGAPRTARPFFLDPLL